MPRLIELGRRQHGVVHLRQAVELGVDRRTLQRQVQRGWERLQPGVYALPGAAPSLLRAASAALLAIGPQAVLGSWTAANLWGITTERHWPVRIIVPEEHHHAALRGIRVTRSSLPDRHGRREGLPVTSPERTVCDLAAGYAAHQLSEMAATAVQLRLTTPKAIDELREALGPRRGSAQVRTAVADLERQGRTDSPLERDIRSLLAAEGFSPAPGTYRLELPDGRIVHLDIAFPEHRVAIEVDGFTWHRTPEQLRRDHERQNAIVAAGWTLLRVSRADLAAPERFLYQLRALIRPEDPRHM